MLLPRLGSFLEHHLLFLTMTSMFRKIHCLNQGRNIIFASTNMGVGREIPFLMKVSSPTGPKVETAEDGY
jgi:predicted metal-dependent phosphotriesterase family hydrolase